MRDSLLQVRKEIKTVGVVGAGHGYSELALAIEFPEIEFTLTDIIDADYPIFHKAMDICWKWDIHNVQFSVWNVLEKTNRQFDLVCSTEVLEHIEEDDAAAAAMREAARKYVYCLVPFADKTTNADQKLRRRALERHGHFVFGYDQNRLTELFPAPVHIKGAYFADAGQQLRHQLSALSADQIDDQTARLKQLGDQDLQDRLPSTPDEGQGIRILSRVLR
ncbi:MAG: hypothetical protein AAGH38_03645 [Pseudomonadota bacterium]